MTKSFSYKNNSDYAFTPKFRAQKLKSKAVVTLLSDKKIRAITGFSKPHFCYINEIMQLSRSQQNPKTTDL